MTTARKESGSASSSSGPGSTAAPDGGVGVEGDGDTGGRRTAIRIAFVEDDEAFREIVSGELADLGFEVECFGDGTALFDAFEGGLDADIVLLDWGLPRVSGIELLPRLRRQGIVAPVVFLTAHSEPNYEQRALENGAVDFVDKTRGVPILAQRLRLVAESSKGEAGPAPVENFVCGRLELKPHLSRALWDGIDLNLTVTEFKIVHLLASNVGSNVAYRAVYDCMHYVGFIAGSGENGYRTNVRSCIKRIRNKFRSIDPGFEEIVNHQAIGYRWGRA